MELNNTKLRQLHEALLSAFPILDELRMMVRFQMNVRLEDIVSGSNLPETTFNLIKWAQAQEHLDDLIQAAYRANPDNRQLWDFVQQYEEEKAREEPGFKQMKYSY